MAVLDIRFSTVKLPVEPDDRFISVKTLKIESTFLVEFDPAVTDVEAVETELRGELEEFWKDVLTDVEEDIPLPEITSEIRWWTRP